MILEKEKQKKKNRKTDKTYESKMCSFKRVNQIIDEIILS